MGPPLVLLHGFTQTGRLWGPLGAHLAEAHTLVAVDLPGHGGSDAVRADLPATAEAVADAVRTTMGPDAASDLLGYSLGVRVALHVALGTRLRLRRVVVIGATAGIEDPVRRTERRRTDQARADAARGLRRRRALRRRLAGLADVLAPLGHRSGRVSERLRNTAAGLASSLRLCGTGTQAPLWGRLGSFPVPLLAVAGTDDTAFAAHALRLAGGVPAGLTSLVPGGGHAAHLAQPDLVARLVGAWLAPGDSTD